MPLDTLVPQAARPTIVASVCLHDCPSACALEVERIDSHTIGRVRGSAAYDYTAGVVCAKVARYAQLVPHPDRLTRAPLRAGPQGPEPLRAISLDAALDSDAAGFAEADAPRGRGNVRPTLFHRPR